MYSNETLSSLESIKTEIERIISDPSSIEMRLRQLSFDEQSNNGHIYSWGTRCRSFISPTTAIQSEGMVLSVPYFIDDPEIYSELSPTLKKVYSKLKDKEGLSEQKMLFNTAFFAVNASQFSYFNNTIGRSNRDKRKRVLEDIISFEDDPRPEFRSISELRDCAMCMERAVVSHNLFKVLGIDSTLVTGHLESEGESEGHAWVELISPEGVKYIYDPQNPQLIVNDEGTIVDFKPLVFTVDEGDVHSTEWKKTNEQGMVIETKVITYSY